MLAKTPDDDVSDLAIMTAAFFTADAGGQPPVETVVMERPRRKPPRHRVLERARDDNGQPVIRVTAAPGFVLDSVVLQEFDGVKCKCAFVFRTSRGKPLGDRPDLTRVAREFNARRAAMPAVTNGAKPNTNMNGSDQ
jgi:hypothetical protein